MIGKTNATSGSGGTSSGGTLTVFAPVGSIVTLSKDEVNMSKIVTGNEVTFTGLTSGAWAVDTVKGTQSDSRIVNLTLDYDETVTFFTSFINVTYPAGSTCSATDGNITLTAPDTTGSWKCEVPNAGTWTVNSSNGELSANGSVTITESGESKSVTLTYKKSIYTAGQSSGFAAHALPENSGETKQAPSLSFGASSMSAEVTTAYAGGCIMTSAKVDLTGYSTLTASGGISGGDCTLCIWSNRGTYWRQYITSSSTFSNSATINVSNLSGSYYIGFGLKNGSSKRGVTVTEIYLT